MRRVSLLLISLLSVVGLHAQTADDLDASFAKARQELDAARKEFADSADAALADYLEYEAQLFKEYERFRDEVMETWGDSVMVESTRKEWVEYSGDRTSRTSVNWESGKVSIEVLTDPSDDEETVRAKLEKAVSELLSSRGTTCGFESSVLPSKPISDRPLLEGQIDLSSYGVSSDATSTAPKPFAGRQVSAPAPTRGSLDLSRNKANAAVDRKPAPVPATQGETMAEKVARQRKEAEAAQQKAKEQAKEQEEKRLKELEALASVPAAVVASQTPKVQEVKTTEGAKNVVTITMELVEDHIPKRAEKFKGMVSRHSSTYSVDEPLIYAIMEQESAFNPAAQSWVPAYGLMQLVPKSGGRDAYRYVHKEDAIPSADFLFDPNNNIQLGTGYLKLLMSTTFKKVENAQCRMLCAIAAYNTGAGNVSRAINGTTNISKAIPTINTMSYDQLFAHLKKALPHAETQDYIQKVTTKMQKYIK